MTALRTMVRNYCKLVVPFASTKNVEMEIEKGMPFLVIMHTLMYFVAS